MCDSSKCILFYITSRLTTCPSSAVGGHHSEFSLQVVAAVFALQLSSAAVHRT